MQSKALIHCQIKNHRKKSVGMIAHIFLLISAASLSSCISRYQYLLVKTPKTWYDAQKHCREKCIDLTTINDMNDMETILKSFDGDYGNATWIGLWKGTTDRWHWSLGGEKLYLAWDTFNYNCGSYKQGKFDSAPCHHAKYSVCFDGTKQGADQYVITAETMTWTEALHYCRTNHTDLTSLRNETEHQIIQGLANGQQVWIGLFKDPWEWSDKSNSSLRYWPEDVTVYSEEDGICGALLQNESGRWGRLPCLEKHTFICFCKKKVTHRLMVKVKIRLQDSLLDDPLVQDDILEEMRRQLGKTVTGDFQLRWRKQPDGKVFTKEIKEDEKRKK